MAAAAGLFGEFGVTGTTMAQIATAVGLQQSSLYYYFSSKEAVLAALLTEANVIPLELVRRIEAGTGSAAVRLYRFVCGDVVALCGLPFDINEVHRYAARDVTRFASYWSERRSLHRAITRIVRDGIASGELRAVNARLAAITVMANDEAVQNWFRHDRRPTGSPSVIATYLAETTVGGLLMDSGSLPAVRAVAEQLDADALS
jgi:AcrR family transcriptional regulator